MIDSSIITLNEKSVKNNISFLKSKLGDKVKISAVVKANAYGHGIEEIVPIFEKQGIDHFSVFYYSEAVRVYNCLSKQRSIMVMGWLCDEDIKDAIIKGIEFFVFDIERLNTAIKFATELNLKAKIHLEAETGMNRSGIDFEDLDSVINIIKKNLAHTEIIGFCTHLAGAESISNHYRIQNQLQKYNEMLADFEANDLIPQYKHVANSAAAFVYPEARMDLVRIGIMLYGFWSSTEVFIQFINKQNNKIDPLRRILGWTSQIMSIKEIKSGEFIGYGISYLAQTNITTALVPIGYSLGYSRSLSNKGRVLIRGKRCSVIGVVNMNMIIIDITNIKHVEVGDEVVLIGKQKKLEIKVSAFSDLSDELNYEILAHLSEGITRKVIKNKIMAFVTLDIKKLESNFEYLNTLFSKNGIEWSVVSKVLSGNKIYLTELLKFDIQQICDSRVTNLKMVKSINPQIETIYIKPPAKRAIASVVKYADISMNTEFETIKLLSEEAKQQNKMHKIIIMIELGELREGVMGEDFMAFYESVFKLKNIQVVGIGANLTCLYGVLPNHDKLIQLSLYEQLIEAKFNRQIKYVSGGSSVTIPLIFQNLLPKGINHFRVGETLFLGTDVYNNRPFKKMNSDIFKLYSEIIELTEKPMVPDGELGTNVEGEEFEFDPENIGETSYRAIIDIGLLDVETDHIKLVDKSLKLAGASSDMIVIDLDKNEKKYKVGDLVEFKLDYMGILRILNSKYIEKK